MEILEKGTKEYTCDRCGCKFSIEASDVKNESMEWGIVFLGLRHYVNCPQCANKIVI